MSKKKYSLLSWDTTAKATVFSTILFLIFLYTLDLPGNESSNLLTVATFDKVVSTLLYGGIFVLVPWFLVSVVASVFFYFWQQKKLNITWELLLIIPKVVFLGFSIFITLMIFFTIVGLFV